jgi:GGDEF domain-containing protein
MSLQGPIVVIAEGSAPAVVEALRAAGASPVIEASRSQAGKAIASANPAAIILADADPHPDPKIAKAFERALAGPAAPYRPVIVSTEGANDWLVPRLRSALRVRALHASVLRRMENFAERPDEQPEMPAGDPLDDATVIVAGRGRAYPALTTAIAAHAGLIGALSLETAADFLKARDVDGLAIGDGFNRRVVDNFLAELGADPRFRDLPIAVLDQPASEIDPERLPNLVCGAGDPESAVAALLPLVRMRALAARLRRLASSLDAKGLLDPITGLRRREVFMRDLKRTIADAEARRVALTLARLSLENLTDRRASLDAARIVARLTRTIDFACRDLDGTILIAFTETDLRSAHVVARRIASVLKHTILAPGRDRSALDPTVTIAALKRRDTAETLIARIAPDGMVAAG